ncbi:peptidylprolyl isomerase [Formosa algae]|uniref:peptidylprolyl isomerase n=1 Tax=Formosa algae TaxID=225843 RepID=A0A9X1C9R7_9FLAO|nr:peptidylprolyl isomerase [Formosa algae]MBP1841591.1 cyclophilin family peptidyl-prolyl cis-trans isomerase [Formosa algae]MDQ0337016.1 cyclophilin family peptidyl-prolyl cis-trans isomerase [Formosa algae]OEI80215.1 peptidylprolyl isomerase [Formosa algae]
MRFLVYCCLFVFLLNCEDTKSKKNNSDKPAIETPVKQTSETKTLQTDAIPEIVEDTREFPVLTDDNAMEFFLEYEKEHKENTVRITTEYGTIDIQLFNETKFHRANFIFLTKQGYFNNTQFYRVVKNFIIQGGGSDDSEIGKRRVSIGKYLLPTDAKRGFKHDRGVISMPSSDIENPYKLASPYEFFIVQAPGGAHHLDGSYTIFGKVIKGMDVVDAISNVETDDAEWPLHNVYIKKVEIID